MRAILTILLFTSSIFAHIEYGSFEFDGYERDYIVSYSRGFEPGLPLVLNLHGYGGNAEEQMDHTLMNRVADTANFVVVYPNATAGIWNSGIADNPVFPTPEVDDVAFLSALIDTIYADYQINLDRVYACGLSNGGFMSFRLASELSDRISKIAAVAGVLTPTIVTACSTYSPIPIMYLVGTADPLVPYYGGTTGWYSVEQTLEYWLNANTCSSVSDTFSLPDVDTGDGCTVEVISYQDCGSETEVLFYKVLGGGHLWPGSGSDFFDWGPINEDISASSHIWNFFNNDNLFATLSTDDPDHESPGKIKLNQNYPNPFNPITTISYDLPKQTEVKLTVFNNRGQEVTTLQDVVKSSGNYEVQWNGVDQSGNPVSTGMYFCRLEAGIYSQTIKMVYLR